MKLLTRINRNFSYTTAALLALCSVFLFFTLRYVIYSDIDENLLDEKLQIINTYKKTGRLPAELSLKSHRISVKPVVQGVYPKPVMKDTLILDSLEMDYVPHRQLSFYVSGNNHTGNYISISQSKLEAVDLITTLMLFVVLFTTVLLLFIFLYNRRMSKKTWHPFYDTLEQLKNFDTTVSKKMEFSKTGIDEFAALNKSLQIMTERIHGDYERMRQFTENAAHEIQTPLSVIINQIELLVQDESWEEEQMQLLQQIYHTAIRLSRLNTVLLTLAKIENNQFTGKEKINLSSFIKKKVKEVDFICAQKNITTRINASADVYIEMNSTEADLLFNNLINNAIKHNIDLGDIEIDIHPGVFTISNTGTSLHMEHEKMFNRFQKADPASPSSGLGLSIVKQVCMKYQYKINFFSEDNRHTIRIVF